VQGLARAGADHGEAASVESQNLFAVRGIRFIFAIVTVSRSWTRPGRLSGGHRGDDLAWSSRSARMAQLTRADIEGLSREDPAGLVRAYRDGEIQDVLSGAGR
jgi:hypothetical protein